MQIGILTGGGDEPPGLNAAIRGVARSAFSDGVDVLGVRNGWAGLVGEGDAFPLRPGDVSGILTGEARSWARRGSTRWRNRPPWMR